MFKSLLKDRKLLILVAVVVLIKLLSFNHLWVEKYYTYGFYPILSGFLRMLFGWIFFSVGDLLYAVAAIFLLVKMGKFLMRLKKGEIKKYLSLVVLKKFLYLILGIYIVFNLFWGLNYNRRGIAYQLQLNVETYSVEDLYKLTQILQQRANTYGSKIDSVKRLELNKNKILFTQGALAYGQVKNIYPFLTYSNASVKPSMFSHIGQYLGFTGYYNPFSGEAQLKTTSPVFLKPFIVCHEIAHQLGYGKENEANFVGYLACKNSSDIDFRYSAYFEMTLYAQGDLRRKDSVAAGSLRQQWGRRMENDYRAYLNYIFKSKNSVEPFVMRFYSEFLKMNNQPKGYKTYNEVVGWLIAYMKKNGEQAI